MINAFAKTVFLLLLSAGILCTACKKENIDLIEERQETIQLETSMKITTNGQTTTVPAYAAYCNANGKEFLSVSNNQDLLDTAITIQDFRMDDFLLFYAIEASDTLTFGGNVFEDTVQGVPIVEIALSSFAEINITSITSTIATGNMSSNLLLTSGQLQNYYVEFTAAIVETSPFCN